MKIKKIGLLVASVSGFLFSAAIPAMAVPKYQLKFVGIQCYQTEDWTGPDEPYLIIDGRQVWRAGSMNNGDVQDLRIVPPVTFFSSSQIKLYDADAGSWFDRDDHLGTVTVTSSQAGENGQGMNHIGRFRGDGASYDLYYTVQQIEW
jgi:hypothetical protein